MASSHESTRRVILVGRTGLDASLRTRGEYELLRVRTPMEAIAELADPIDDQSPREAVIVLGEGAQPGIGARADEPIEDVVTALRLIDEDVRVLVTGAEAHRASWTDGVIHASMDARAIDRALLGPLGEGRVVEAARGYDGDPAARDEHADGPRLPHTDGSVSRSYDEDAPNSPSPAAPPAGEVMRTTRPAAAIETTQAASSGFGGVDPVSTLARGEDPVAAMLVGLRTALNDPTVRVELASGAKGAAIVWRGASVGVLTSDRHGPEALAPYTAALAPWLVIREQQRVMRLAAYSDPLTGAWNRRYFDQFLRAALDAAREQRHSVTVLVFDIDNFKSFNDSCGHEAGDEILKETVRLLRSVIRPTDRVCRIGGDEFAVIFDEPHGPRDPASRHPTSIYTIAQRFQHQVRAATFPKLSKDLCASLSISGGLATFPWDGLTAEDLLRRADALALEGKRLGKNVIVYGPGAGASLGAGATAAERPPSA